MDAVRARVRYAQACSAEEQRAFDRELAAHQAFVHVRDEEPADIAIIASPRLDERGVRDALALLRGECLPSYLLVAAIPDLSAVNTLFAHGVRDVFWSPHWTSLIDRLAFHARRGVEVERLLQSPLVQENLLGSSPAWSGLLRQVIAAAAFSDLPILLHGETGTGKELLARLVHSLDRRPEKGDLVVVDCTMGAELAQSELFGHERGAFTGAHAARRGAAALADGGTLFLDEVGELHPAIQAQLLRLLQEGTYKTVGGNTWQKSSFRVVCATHRDLPAAVAEGRFRADLYFRLAACVAEIPPLRERVDDVPFLANKFLVEFGCSGGADEMVLAVLRRYGFPGNVRELRQIMLQTALAQQGEWPVTIGALPRWLYMADDSLPAVERAAPPVNPEHLIEGWVADGLGLREITQRAGDLAIQVALRSENNHLGKAARRLGVTERAIQLRRANGRAAPDFRPGT